jgi:hypothetical protein
VCTDFDIYVLKTKHYIEDQHKPNKKEAELRFSGRVPNKH